MMDRIEEIKRLIEEKIKEVNSLDKLNELKQEFQGKKGYITAVQAMIKDISNEKKKEFGMKLNELRTLFNTKYEEVREIFMVK